MWYHDLYPTGGVLMPTLAVRGCGLGLSGFRRGWGGAVLQTSGSSSDPEKRGNLFGWGGRKLRRTQSEWWGNFIASGCDIQDSKRVHVNWSKVG